MDLSSGVEQLVLSQEEVPFDEGDIYPVSISIGNLDEKYAGNYSDVVYINTRAL